MMANERIKVVKNSINDKRIRFKAVESDIKNMQKQRFHAKVTDLVQKQRNLQQAKMQRPQSPKKKSKWSLEI
jgi:hypothetical protein